MILQICLAKIVRECSTRYANCTAIDELQRLKAHLQEQWQCPVSIDVTELAGYHYHTGIVFNGYINSETQPLVRGGRFDGMKS